MIDFPAPPVGPGLGDDLHAAWVREVLARVIMMPSRAWSVTRAVREPGGPPVDIIMLAEDWRDEDLVVVWIRYPGSYTGTVGSQITCTGRYCTDMVAAWAAQTHQLADLVETIDTCVNDAQAAYLRWTAAYGQAVVLGGLAVDKIREAHDDGVLDGQASLGDLTGSDITAIASGARPFIPPGWVEDGWEPAHLSAAPTAPWDLAGSRNFDIPACPCPPTRRPHQRASTPTPTSR
ncbi:hypothetical protein [Actinomadura hibisca]|uniref:hypothetical protein n=1 Tax=Actinomadura hibisca TaxID=68565 RepID=UPI0008340212|nr:hypothetical protein [Actinomadura hibisca]